MIYELSVAGRACTYSRWKDTLKGCSLPNNTMAYRKLGPESHWDNEFPTLGQIADACPATGRSLARFAIEFLQNDLMVRDKTL
jgi:hypothetical protein